MCTRVKRTLLTLMIVTAGSTFVVAQTAPHDQHKADTHTHAAAAKLKNPVASDAASVASGRQLFTRHCAACHGPNGDGNGPQAAKFTPKPSNLVDAEWKHGPSDGEMFTVIRAGAPKTAMSAFKAKMTERETWDVVNYLRSLGAPQKAH